jgi:predicted aspartyl protease
MKLAAVAFAAASFACDLALAQSGCRFLRVVEWPVRMITSKIVVEGAINGKKVGVFLDTGATRSMIMRAAAVRLDLPKHDAPGVRMFGVGGETKAEVAVIDEFMLGQVPVKGLALLVAGEREPAPGIDMLLGEDFLQRFDIEFDLPHNMVRLYQPKDCEKASLAYWTKDVAGEVEIERIDDSHPKIALTVQVNDKPLDALLDSGAWSTVLTTAQAASLGVTPESAGPAPSGKSGGLGARSVDWYVGAFKSFAIGNESIPDVRMRFADIWKDSTYTDTGSRVKKSVAASQPMLLGADFLRAHRVLVSHSQRKLYFTYVGGPVFDTGERTVGPR